jgi:hypothetical protein
MTEPIRPIRRTGPVRRVEGTDASGRTAHDQEDTDLGSNLPVPVSPPREEPTSAKPSAAAFAAQILGQPGQKRGLKSGQETLDRARSTYMETEWSGPSDRRLRSGRITKTEI